MKHEDIVKPNLFIVGAMKSGTTSLHNYLDMHPDIFMSVEKEPGYFVRAVATPDETGRYLALFTQGHGKRYVGESSTHYAKRPTNEGVAQRIHDFNPEARIIYVMRDPIRRIVSHYWHNVRDLEVAETRDLLGAVRKDPQYRSYSDYAMQLEPYIDLFGADHVYTMTFEELTARPVQAVNGLLRWLGLTDLQDVGVLGQSFNEKPAEFHQARGFGFLNRLRYSGFWAGVAFLFPKQLRSVGNVLAQKKADELAQKSNELELQRVLKEEFRGKVEELSRMLHRDFPEWNTLR